MASTICRLLHVTAVVCLVWTSSGNHQNSKTDRGTKIHYFDHEDPHGGVKMGVIDQDCDDGQTGIEMDWDPRSEEEYTCDIQEDQFVWMKEMGEVMGKAFLEDQSNAEPIHMCLDEPIIYKNIPLSGPHRPLWPEYGEYIYLPPQRWVHSLEHGAVVLLYHPCVAENDPDLVQFKAAVKGCLRKHIITPSKLLSAVRPFAVLAYQHGLMLNNFDFEAVTTFIQERAQKAPESHEFHNGQYKVGLLHKARLVSDLFDSDICPTVPL